METVEDILKDYNIALDKPKKKESEVDKILAEYGVSLGKKPQIEIPKPFMGEYKLPTAEPAVAEPATTLVSPPGKPSLMEKTLYGIKHPTETFARGLTKATSLVKSYWNLMYESPEQAMTAIYSDMELNKMTPMSVMRTLYLPATLGGEAIKRPHMAVKSAINAMQKIEEEYPKDANPYSFREQMRLMSHVSKSFWTGLAGRDDTSGRDIVKNMGVPIDDDEFAIRNPTGAYVGQFLANWYEFSTDPISWYILGNVDRLVHAHRLAKQSIKLFKETEKLFDTKLNFAKVMRIKVKNDIVYGQNTSTGQWIKLNTDKKAFIHLERELSKFWKTHPEIVNKSKSFLKDWSRYLKNIKSAQMHKVVVKDMIAQEKNLPAIIPKRPISPVTIPTEVAIPTKAKAVTFTGQGLKAIKYEPIPTESKEAIALAETPEGTESLNKVNKLIDRRNVLIDKVDKMVESKIPEIRKSYKPVESKIRDAISRHSIRITDMSDWYHKDLEPEDKKRLLVYVTKNFSAAPLDEWAEDLGVSEDDILDELLGKTKAEIKEEAINNVIEQYENYLLSDEHTLGKEISQTGKRITELEKTLDITIPKEPPKPKKILIKNLVDWAKEEPKLEGFIEKLKKENISIPEATKAIIEAPAIRKEYKTIEDFYKGIKKTEWAKPPKEEKPSPALQKIAEEQVKKTEDLLAKEAKAKEVQKGLFAEEELKPQIEVYKKKVGKTFKAKLAFDEKRIKKGETIKILEYRREIASEKPNQTGYFHVELEKGEKVWADAGGLLNVIEEFKPPVGGAMAGGLIPPKDGNWENQLSEMGFFKGKGSAKYQPSLEPESITGSQIKAIHIKAREVGLIYKSERTGKIVNARYKKFLKNYTEVTTSKKLSEAQAIMVLDYMDRLTLDRHTGRPVIPTTKTAVPRDWFLTMQKKFGAIPGEVTKLVTPQWLQWERIGLGEVGKGLYTGRIDMDSALGKTGKLIKKWINTINIKGEIPQTERIRAKLRNIPTKAVERFMYLLDEYQTPPDFLSAPEKKIFTQIRGFTEGCLKVANKARARVGKPLIKHRKGYIRHIITDMARDIINDKYPFPEVVKYYMKKNIGQPWNPTVEKRTIQRIKDDLYNVLSKDLERSLTSMAYYTYKEIFLSEPIKYAKDVINLFVHDIPEGARTWMTKYINEVIKGQIPKIDEDTNRMIRKVGLEKLINTVLKPFNRSLGRNPIKNIMRLVTFSTHLGTIPGKPWLVIRNKTQIVQETALYPLRDVIASKRPIAWQPKEMEADMNKSTLLRSYSHYEDLPMGLRKILTRVWPLYQWSAVDNARSGFKTAWHAAWRLYQDPKWRAKGWTRQEVRNEADYGMGTIHYLYHVSTLPQIFRYSTARPLTVLQSWWQNHIFGFSREHITRLVTGKTRGLPMPWSWRIGSLRYLMLGSLFLATIGKKLGFKRSFLLGVAPVYLSPQGQFIFSLYNYLLAKYSYFIADTDKQRNWANYKTKKARKGMWWSATAMIPYSGAMRRFHEIWTGQKTWESAFFYGAEKQPKSTKPKLYQIKPK